MVFKYEIFFGELSKISDADSHGTVKLSKFISMIALISLFRTLKTEYGIPELIRNFYE